MSEKNFDFDTIIERRNTMSIKYDFAEHVGLPSDVLPLWIADMDFKTSSYIQEALIDVVNHGIFGYSEALSEYNNTVIEYFHKKYNYDFEENELRKTPGVVFAIATAIRALSEEGDAVLIQSPVYHPFAETIIRNGRKVVDNTLVYRETENRYYVDFEDFEQKIIDNNVKLFLLCNPHNPVSRVWSVDELLQLGEICLKHNVIILSDEIHADFTFVGKHHVFASLSQELENNTITFTSPSKTFNLAGLQLANIIIKNPKIRRAFAHAYKVSGYSEISIMGYASTIAAYKNGDQWFNAVFDYIKKNVEYVKKFVDQYLPGVRVINHEATYLVWLDFRKVGLSADELDHKIIFESKLWLNSGRIFGKTGEGFQRINVACPRKTLEEAMNRLKKVFG
ncbi:MAG: pyridoxal phosphate-dependent aminotransferase [Paludibacteraceae bacterium]|nr:pyridoxal phosphate-dependent aminotransferase [Paludibacteraceae bacterium]